MDKKNLAWQAERVRRVQHRNIQIAKIKKIYPTSHDPVILDKSGARKKKGVTPAELSTVTKRPEPGEILENKNQSKNQSGIRKMMHVM